VHGVTLKKTILDKGSDNWLEIGRVVI